MSQRFSTRVFVALALAAVPPVVLLAAVLEARLSRTFEESSERRARQGLQAAQSRLKDLRQRAAARLAQVAQDGPLDEPDPELAERLGARHELPVLALLDAEGRVVSSRHWPAGFGLEDRGRAVKGGPPWLRREFVAEGYGGVERLAVVATRPVTAGSPALLRGGFLLDDALMTELSTLLGAQAGVLENGRWIAPASSPLRSWPQPRPSAGTGTTRLGDAGWTWAAAELAPSLFVVVADSRRDEEELLAGVRRWTVAVSAAALVAALALGAWISRRVTRPVGALAEGAHRIASGDLEASVTPAGGAELEALATAFNEMARELRDSRERLLQAERVAAWREMARRLAHELKNPLFPIQLSIETLRRAHDRGERSFPDLFRESSATILDEIGALRRIIEEFSQFARMPRPQPRPTQVNAVVRQVLALYEARAEGVAVEASLAPGLPEVPADPELLSRALSNLVANAVEAMPEGGTLRVATHADAAGVAVEVSDTGPGLDDDQRRRLFTPYFTTKRGGTGLGLAIVQGIVADHGGRVEVASEPGAGTTFTLRLPAVAPPPELLHLAEEREAAPVRESTP